jgi:hypothetical protein
MEKLIKNKHLRTKGKNYHEFLQAKKGKKRDESVSIDHTFLTCVWIKIIQALIIK